MRLILVSGQPDGAWAARLKETLAPPGELIIAGVKEMEELRDNPDDVLIVDATSDDEAEATVRRLRDQRPERRIVVVTASPTWARARAAFEAGAIDYLSKSLTPPELFAAIEEIRRRPLPPWPR